MWIQVPENGATSAFNPNKSVKFLREKTGLQNIM